MSDERISKTNDDGLDQKNGDGEKTNGKERLRRLRIGTDYWRKQISEAQEVETIADG